MCCVRSWPRRQISLGAARYQLSIKVNRPYLSYILYLNTILTNELEKKFTPLTVVRHSEPIEKYNKSP